LANPADRVLEFCTDAANLSVSEVKMMDRVLARVYAFIRNEDGPTAVEYAVMLALIIIVCIAAIAVLGKNASGTFSTVGQSIKSGS
jgi:pilus assembly protein Flp/PilA